MDNLEKNIQDILETVNFIKDNSLSKDEAKNFATKDDLKNFATKDDLKNFATKDDLKNFATKDDLKNFATKDDLAEFKDEIMTHLDKFIVLNQQTDMEFAALRAKYERLENLVNETIASLKK